ncbi:Immunoglobulin lambda variable 8-61 [Vulpes lagopus]
MAGTVLFLGLLAHGLGADSQIVVTQETSLSVSPGGRVTLTCGLSSGSVTTSNYPNWFQQTPEQSPGMIIYSTNSLPSGVPDRFSGSISGNKAAFTMTGAQPEDEAITVLQDMAVGAATLTHSISDKEKVRQKPLGPFIWSSSLRSFCGAYSQVHDSDAKQSDRDR